MDCIFFFKELENPMLLEEREKYEQIKQILKCEQN